LPARRKATKEFLSSSEWELFRKEHIAADDRSCAILLVSYLDNCLHVLASKVLGPASSTKELLGDMMPLGTFSSRIKLARSLNVIPQAIYADLNRVRSIRNAFAHQLHGLSFDKNPIYDYAMTLATPASMVDPQQLAHSSWTPRQRFTLTCAVIASTCESYYYTRAEMIRASIESAEPVFPDA